MQLNEVLKDIKPAAEAMLRRGLTMQQASKALYLTYALVNVEKWGDQKTAAENMGVSESYLSKILSGQAKLARPPLSRQLRAQEAAAIVGAVEL